MKKITLLLAAIAMILVSCKKTDTAQAVQNASLKQVPLQITLSMPDDITPASGTRATGFEVPDAANPLKLIGKWKGNTTVNLIVFQGDAANWQTKFVRKSFTIPFSAEGQTTVDLTAAAGTIDLSTLDPAQPIKYMIGISWNWSPGDNHISFGNAPYPVEYANGLMSAPSGQNRQLQDMILATDVTEAPFPTADNPLQLTAKMKWLTAVLAVQFSFEGFTADDFVIDKDQREFRLCLVKPGGAATYPDRTDLVQRKATDKRTWYYFGTQFSATTATKFNASLGVSGVPAGIRYFTIPASNTIEGVNVDGSELWMGRIKYSSTSGDFSDNIEWQNSTNAYKVADFPATTAIEAGKCYGIKLKFVKTGDKLVLQRQ